MPRRSKRAVAPPPQSITGTSTSPGMATPPPQAMSGSSMPGPWLGTQPPPPPQAMTGSSMPGPWLGACSTLPPQGTPGTSAPGPWWGALPRPQQAEPKFSSDSNALNSDRQDWCAGSATPKQVSSVGWLCHPEAEKHGPLEKSMVPKVYDFGGSSSRKGYRC
ncbi:hypothetical protein ACP70R_048591 [Stipagrostis hirtigluma subsp. patula]